MTAKCTAIIVGLIVFSIQPIVAQRIADYALLRTAQPSRMSQTFSAAVADSEAHKRRTYWLEGALVGGVITGALGVELSQLCAGDTKCHHSKLLGFVIGAVPGFTIGAFMGDTMKKGPVENEPD